MGRLGKFAEGYFKATKPHLLSILMEMWTAAELYLAGMKVKLVKLGAGEAWIFAGGQRGTLRRSPLETPSPKSP
ncbi:MAG: hypothetical protein AABZ84_07080, partial [Pseudomonadota bacterium]